MSGSLSLDLLDVYGRHVAESIDLFFHNSAPGPIPCARNCDASKTIRVTDLPSGTYKLEIDIPCYRDIAIFTNIADDGSTSEELTALIDPRRVIAISAPMFTGLSAPLKTVVAASIDLLSGAPADRYLDALDPIRKAGFLNLTTKASATRQANGAAVFSTDTFQQFTELRGDRLFAIVSEKLLSDTRDSCLHGTFHSVDESLHSIPGCDPVASFKTNDRYGNLQLSFFRRSADGKLLVDMDIDDAQGFEHIFQVLGNALTGEPTHPYSIHEILIAYQRLDPGYELQVRPQTRAQTKKAKAGKNS